MLTSCDYCSDSLAYAVQTDGIYRDMANDAADRYDFSEYHLDHPLYDTSNRKALGLFKDELNSVPLQDSIGLRPKYYAFLCTGKVDKNVLQYTRPVEKKTAKGVKRKAKDDHLHFVHYLDVLRSFKSHACKHNLISSTDHTVRTVHTRKVDMTAFDTKRWLCEDTVRTHWNSHKVTLSDPSDLFTKCYNVNSLASVGIYSHNDLPGTSSLAGV